MFPIFEKYLSERASLTDQDFKLIQSLSVEKKLSKGEFILREGEICKKIVFVTKGVCDGVDPEGNVFRLKQKSHSTWNNYFKNGL